MWDFGKRRKPEGYECRIAEELISYVKQKIREERTSRLFDRDNAYLVAEDLHALENLRNELAVYEDLFKRRAELENENEALEKSLKAVEAELTAANLRVDQYKQHWAEAEHLLQETAAVQSENADLKRQLEAQEKVRDPSTIQIFTEKIGNLESEKRRLAETLAYVKPLLDLQKDELFAAVSVLPFVIPPKTDIEPARKYHATTAGHHRPSGYYDFIRQLCQVDYITNIAEWGLSRSMNREPVRINKQDGRIIVLYHADKPQELLVTTTARTPEQQAFVAAYIKHLFFRNKEKHVINL